MRERRKKLRTLMDYQGRMWMERADGLWACYDDSTGKTRSGLPAPPEADIALDAEELKKKK